MVALTYASSQKEKFMATAHPPLTQAELEALRQIDTCMVSNAIETFGVRLRNEGFADASIRCMVEDAPPMVGYAVTARFRSDAPPREGNRGSHFHDRSDFWNHILAMPAPRVVVLEDMDKYQGRGAFLGDVHAAILKALGCVGFVTNGAIRELPVLRTMGLQLFAGSVAVSHAFAHIFDFGAAVKLGGIELRPGDLLHGDRHGLLTVPREIAAAIPAVARGLQQEEKRVIDFCQSSGFSIEGLKDVIKGKG
jgi:4-hydroxy-4-methyl-2-oxoglutarate aldolase